jgi:hypothetical protein
MKLTLIFVCTFLGVILAVAGTVAFFKAPGRLMDWLKLKIGRSDTEVTLLIYVVLMALVVAGGGTVAVSSGESR